MPVTEVENVLVDGDSSLERLRVRVVAFCAEAGYILSPQAEQILNDLMNMKQTDGDFYCPCQPQRLPQTVCVCEAVRSGLVDVMGACFCHLILSRDACKE